MSADKQAESCDVGQTLLPIDEALALLSLRAISLTDTDEVALKAARGRILASDLSSKINVPPADNSAMDGYAIRTSDFSQSEDKQFKISQRICAGARSFTLEKGTVARIFTGAQIPENADAVVMQENCEVVADKVIIKGSVSPGMNVRKAGEDIRENTIILKAGKKLRAQDLGLAASVGFAVIPVKRRLRVAVFFTGDELREPGETLEAGQIYNSNRYTLHGLLDGLGCEVIDLGVVKDSLEATIEAMQNVAEQADLVMTSGGVSVGEEDHIRKALETLGELELWRINIKPGKPLAFGHINRKDSSKSTPFLGLPGNPVSVFATFCIFARLFILKMQGSTDTKAQSFMVASGFELSEAEKRNEYLRARIETDASGKSTASIYPNQGSGVLTSASWANGLVFIPENTMVEVGDMLEFIPFSELSVA
jgi:molybdopterin molybdotransferase